MSIYASVLSVTMQILFAAFILLKRSCLKSFEIKRFYFLFSKKKRHGALMLPNHRGGKWIQCNGVVVHVGLRSNDSLDRPISIQWSQSSNCTTAPIWWLHPIRVLSLSLIIVVWNKLVFWIVNLEEISNKLIWWLHKNERWWNDFMRFKNKYSNLTYMSGYWLKHECGMVYNFYF